MRAGLTVFPRLISKRLPAPHAARLADIDNFPPAYRADSFRRQLPAKRADRRIKEIKEPV